MLYFVEQIAWSFIYYFHGIVCVFLACVYCDRFSAWSCQLKRAVYSTPHCVWSVYRVSRVTEWIVL